MTTQLTQRGHDEAAHERLAEIRKTISCEEGREAAMVRYLYDQYQLVVERLNQIEREAAEEEAEIAGRYR